MKNILLAALVAGLVSACSPEVGSDDWCKSLKEKRKAEWTAQEAKDYAKNCIFK